MATKWDNTPFTTIEEAHQFADKMGLRPSAITLAGAFRSFTTSSGLMLAQRGTDGPVRERKVPKRKRRVRDPAKPSYEENKMLTGPWTRSDHTVLEDVIEHLHRCYPNNEGYKVVAVGRVLVIRTGKIWWEYIEKTRGDVRVRVLASCPPWREECCQSSQVDLVPNAGTLEGCQPPTHEPAGVRG